MKSLVLVASSLAATLAIVAASGCTGAEETSAEIVSAAQEPLSSYCSRGVNNLCNIPEENRQCSSNAQWVQGYNDYQALCASAGGVDYVCTRGVNNLCFVPELQRNCQTTAQWNQGYYDYQDLCPSAGRSCGSQPATPTVLSNPTELAGGSHPGDAAHDANYNLTVRGYTSTGTDPATYGFIGGNADYSAINLTNLWPGRARPSNPFSTQYEVKTPDGHVSPSWKAIASGLNFNNCQDVILPSTGLPGSPKAPSCNGSQPAHVPRLINSSPVEQAIVVYAGASTLTLQFTLRDGPTGGAGSGYTVYLDHVEVNPGIIADYQAANLAGRGHLPALSPNATLGRAKGTQVVVAVRDTNTWMDPRFKKDWWQDAWTAADGTFPCNGD